MKVETKKIKINIFEPFEITLMLETENEASMFFSLFNHSSLATMMKSKGLNPELICNSIETVMGKLPKYIDCHNQLCRLVK